MLHTDATGCSGHLFYLSTSPNVGHGSHTASYQGNSQTTIDVITTAHCKLIMMYLVSILTIISKWTPFVVELVNMPLTFS